MSDFTKGPWRLSETWRPRLHSSDPSETNGEGNVFWGYSISGSDENGTDILPTLAAVHNFPDNIHANAHLIAASPDLYDALDGMISGLAEAKNWAPGARMDRFEKVFSTRVDAAKSALSEARGET